MASAPYSSGRSLHFDAFGNISTEFVGREAQLREITEHFSTKSNDRPRILSICGLAGEGKSRLALEFCNRSRKTYCGLFWINARSDMMAMQSFEKIAAEFGAEVGMESIQPSRSIKLVRAELRSWNERWLMVFDSYDRPEDFPDIKRLIPSGGRGDILFTSRNNDLCKLGSVLKLPPLTEDEALELLLRGYKKHDIERYKSDWSEVARRLGYLALSLDQAATYLKYLKISIESSKEFLAVYEGKWDPIAQYLTSNFWDLWKTQCRVPAEQDRAISAFVTWEMVLDRLGSVDGHPEDSVRHFLALLAFFDPTQTGDLIFRQHWNNSAPAWMNIFTSLTEEANTSGEKSVENVKANSGDPMRDASPVIQKEGLGTPISQGTRKWDSERLGRCVRGLNELSLLNGVSGIDPERASFHLHPLIRDWAQVRLTPDARQAYTQEATAFVLSATLMCSSNSASAQERLMLTVHMDACVWNDSHFTHPDYCLGRHESNCFIAEWFATFYRIPGRYELARKLASLVMETRTQSLGAEHSITVGVMDALAEIYGQLGRWEEAEKLKKQVIAAGWRTLGTSATEISEAFRRVRGLILMYQREERWKEVEDLSLDMIEKIKQISTDDGLDMMLANRILASTYQVQHKWEAATELFSSVLEANTRMFGAKHPTTLEGKMDLARVLVFQGQRKAAELLEEEVREARRTVAVVTDPHWINNLENLSGEGESKEVHQERSKPRRKWLNPNFSDTERIREILLASKMPSEQHAKMLCEDSDIPIDGFEGTPVDESKDGIEYITLDQDEPQIRLLTVNPGNFDDKIHAKLSHGSFTTNLDYTALSYCWGEAKENAEICLNGRKTQVTKSLEIALKYLRKVSEDVVLWVDAICINQNDLREKSSQVRMMGEIYSSASDVRVWLGESADNSDAAMDFLNEIDKKDFASPKFELQEDVWVALRHLRKRKWWSRMWVIQEALFAKRLKFYCGWKSADRTHFAQLHDIERRYDHGKGYGKRLQAMSMSLAAPFGVILTDWDKYKKEIADGGVRLRRFLAVTNDSRCTEPLDNIFALLSMCSELDRKILQIDYRVSVRWLMIKLCKYELIARESYNPLWILQTDRSNKDPMLPSWVPDYTSHDEDGRLAFPGPVLPGDGEKLKYTAAADNTAWTSLGLAALKPVMIDYFNSIKVNIEDEGSFETLVLTGLVVDVVQATFRAPWVDLYEGFDLEEDTQIKARRRKDLIDACKEWEKYIQDLPPERDHYRSTCGRYEAFWRTLIADRDFLWDGPPSQAQDFVGRFEAWMGRHEEKAGDEDFIQPFNGAAIVRCMRRSFMVTEKGYFGLGSCYPRPSDLVCVLRGGDVPFVLRPRLDEYYEWVGEAYVHGIMDGSFVRTAKRDQLQQFKIR